MGVMAHVKNWTLPQNKKGLLFTITAIALLGLAVLLLGSQSETQRQADQFVVTQRLQSMNKFIDNIAQDASFALYASGFRSVLAVVEQVTSTGEYMNNPAESIANLIVNGTLNETEAAHFLLQNNTITNWTAKMQQQADTIGVDLTIEVTNLIVNQTSPWEISVFAEFDATLTDQRGLAWWEFNFSQTSSVEIEGFEDPVYVIGTGNLYSQLINRSPVDGQFVIGADTSNLQDHMTNGWYIASNLSPSFLGRLAGITVGEEYGIESLVDKDALSILLPIDVDSSNVDILYFQSSGITAYDFFNMPATFRLDNTSYGAQGRVERYELEGLIS